MNGAADADGFATPVFAPRDPGFAERFKTAHELQPFLTLIGAEIVAVEAGRVTVEAPLRPDLLQHHGFAHGGVIATLLDIAGGFASGTLMAADRAPISVELKISFLAPGKGVRLAAHGRVLKPGGRITTAESRVVAIDADGRETLCGAALGTFYAAPSDPA